MFFIAYFCYKDIDPLKVKVSKILFNESNEQKEKYIASKFKLKTEPKSKEKIKYHKNHYPPKKAKSRHTDSDFSNYDKTIAKTEEKKLVAYKRNKTKNSTKKNYIKRKLFEKNCFQYRALHR